MWISKKKFRERLDREFDHGIEVGKDLGAYDTAEEARQMYEDGKIEWWLEKQRPKTHEEWVEWEKENGPLD
ncbi:MAG: hypothetical protein ACRC5T_03355 [Cetobacterium sp.]